MTPKELFSLVDTPGVEFGFLSIADFYWTAEYFLARESGIPYSVLVSSTAEVRTCDLCGTICDTDEYGRVPRQCDNKQCATLREFWLIVGFPRFTNMVSQRNPRYSVLKNRMKTFLGCNNLAEIPKEIRMDFLLNFMIERIADEQNNRGT